MATASGGAQATGPEQLNPDALGDLMAPDAGRLQKRSRRRGTWKDVFALVRVNLWWMDAKEGQACPMETGAWRKGRQIALVRGETKIQHTEGDLKFAVVNGNDQKEFKANSVDMTTVWVTTLRRRVTVWKDLLEGKGTQTQDALTRIECCGEALGPLSKAHVETA